MKHTLHRRLPALALALALSLSAPALAAETTDRESSAHQAATYAMQYGMADSVQYALWEDRAVTLSGHAGAYSRTENRALLDTDLYGIGSVSKLYTTAAVLQLAQAGKLRLDAPVTRYLPQFKMADQRYRDITLRMLLNHSSGLMGSSTNSAFLFDDTDRTATEELLERLSTQRLKADPGAYSVYCNDGFTLAELVVEAVTGQSFPDYVEEKLLAPAGLENTYAPQDDFDTSRLARTYLDANNNRPLARECLGIVGAGGLYASASDLAAFGGALTGDKLLNAASRKAMAAAEYARGVWPEDTDDSLSYGLGWDSVALAPFSYNDIQALAKAGDTLRYHAGLVVLPEYGMAAAVVSSGGVSTFNELAAVRMLIDALAERGVTVDETAPALPAAAPAAMPAGLTQYAGYYGSTMQQFQAELSAEGKLILRSLTSPSAPVQTFIYHSDGSFRDASGAALMRFVEASNGKTYLYQKAYTPIPGLGTLPTSNYAAVRLEASAPSAKAQAAWDAVNTTPYFLMSEKYSSQVWLSALAGVAELPEYAPGYIGSSRIVDETQAVYELQIPGSGGRDGQDFRLEDRGGTAWYTANGLAFADRSVLRPIYGGEGSRCTIQPEGYARWFVTGALAGSTLSVEVPEDGGFTVYNANGLPVASSAAWGDTSVTLPEDGYVAFAGAPGACFLLDFQAPAA